MKSAQRERSTSVAEVTDVSRHGFWLLLDSEELFVSFEQFPWFRDASIRSLTNLEHPTEDHLHWPDLDIDLAVVSIRHPEDFPLIARLAPSHSAPFLHCRTSLPEKFPARL